MVTGASSCRGPGREDAGVRRARCCPGNDRGHPDRRRGRVPDDAEWDARGRPRSARADGNAVFAGSPETSGAGSAPRRRIRSAPAAAAGSRHRRTAAHWFLQDRKIA